METQTSTNKFASTAAYIGAALFALLIILFNTMPQNILVVSIVAVAFHVVLFPVVAALPSTDWAKAGGYGWLSLDIAANIMLLNGVDIHICTALRYGAHISAIIWIITASLKGNRSLQVVGILQALIMGSYSFIAPWAPMEVLYPAMVLLIVWLILSGRLLSKI